MGVVFWHIPWFHRVGFSGRFWLHFWHHCFSSLQQSQETGRFFPSTGGTPSLKCADGAGDGEQRWAEGRLTKN